MAIASGRIYITAGVIENYADCGLFVNEVGTASVERVTIQNGVENACGVTVVHGSFLRLEGSTVQNNAGDGVDLINRGSALILSTAITGNGGLGVFVGRESYLQVGQSVDGSNEPATTITGNAGPGVLVQDLSMAFFANAPNVITNNDGGVLDVDCEPEFPVTRGALTRIGGGKTNCTH